MEVSKITDLLHLSTVFMLTVLSPCLSFTYSSYSHHMWIWSA